MDKTKKDQPLFGEFPAVTTEAWEEQIAIDLKGADYDKKLVWKTLEGFHVRPYYRKDDLKGLAVMEAGTGVNFSSKGPGHVNNDWEMRQDFSTHNYAEANKKIIYAISRGTNSIGLKICTKEIDSTEKFGQLLKGIDLAKISVHFASGKGSAKIAAYLEEFAEKNGIPTVNIKGSFNYGPIGHLTTKGKYYVSGEDDVKALVDFVNDFSQKFPGIKFIGVDGSVFGNAGANIVQEIAFSLAMAADYLEILTSNGIPIDRASSLITFTFGLGPNYFLEIAKLRAVRHLWDSLVSAFGLGKEIAAPMYIHSETLAWNKTIYDPHVNILRATTEAMSAVLGGTDSLCVLPYNSIFAHATGFSERIARNIQVILKEEAYLDKIADPAAGSYYIENVTEKIAHQAWDLFLKIEDLGGYTQAFKKGAIQEWVGNMANERLVHIAQRKEVLLGTNQYPNANEKVKDLIVADLVFGGAFQNDNLVAQPIRKIRGAQPFEQLRLRTESHSHRPKVFLLTLGNITMRKARAGFASSFFACAGYEIVDNQGFEHVEQGVGAALQAKADIVVVCSSDEEYAGIVPQINEMLKNKAILVVAGAPQCMEELRSKGIRHFIHLRSNLLETLEGFHHELGIQ
jgi:methylmalonyl-CoA mutase